MFQLTPEEAANLRSQTGISSSSHGGRRYRPYAFTEHGVTMLAAVLQSPRAVQVSIEVVRAFVRLRAMLAGNTELARKLTALESGTTRSSRSCSTQFASSWRHRRRRVGASDSRRDARRASGCGSR